MSVRMSFEVSSSSCCHSATTIELSAEAIVAQQSDEMLPAQLRGKLDKHIVVAQVVVDCFEDVEDLLGRVAHPSGRAKPITRFCAELRDEVLVGGDVKVHPESPVVALLKVEAVEIAGSLLEGDWVVVLEFDGLLLAFL
jgi:hypothetical protein